MPHEILGAEHVSFAQKRADVGRADGDAVQLDLIDHVARKAVRRAVIAQTPGVSLAAPAEPEIVSDNKADNAKLKPDAAQKLLPRHMHRFLRKAEKLHAVDAEQTPDEIGAVGRAVDERHGRPSVSGCVSNVMTAGSTPSASARSVVRFKSAAWPRCTPSKKPSARTHFLSAMNDQTSKKLFTVTASPPVTRPMARNSPLSE